MLPHEDARHNLRVLAVPLVVGESRLVGTAHTEGEAVIVRADARAIPLADKSVQCVVTSPPYFGLRDYGVSGQIGLEETPDAYVAQLVAVFREMRRVLKDDGTLWMNLGDSYAGSGKGGNPVDSPHQKQRTNAGSMTVVGNTAREAARTRGAGDDRLYGAKPKDLLGIPWRVCRGALRASMGRHGTQCVLRRHRQEAHAATGVTA